MGHASGPALRAVLVGLWALTLAVPGCAKADRAGPADFASLRRDWFYVPGPYRTTRETGDGPRDTIVSAEVDGAWTVRTGRPPTTIAVVRLPDGRPATAWIADGERGETAVFDPPLALLPSDEVAVTSGLAIYRGVHPQGPPPGLEPTNTGRATRRFLGFEPLQWTWQGRPRPAQVLRHELVLSLSPAEVRQTYESVAVEGLGIVEEASRERVSVLGVVVRSSRKNARLVEFVDGR